MSQKTLYRLQILQNIEDGLRLIHEGPDYRTTTVTVSPQMLTVDAVEADKTPWYHVFGGGGSVPEGPISHEYREEISTIIWGYVKKTAGWTGSLRDRMEEALGDVIKMLDSDLTRGGQCALLVRREILTLYDEEGQWAHFSVEDRYSFKTKMP